MSGKLVIANDFNIHMDKKTDTECSQLSSLIESFGLVQHVSGLTYIKGHMRDLVISRAEDDIVQGCTVGSFISDHNAIHFSVKSGKQHSTGKSGTTRKIKSINPTDFSKDILSSELLTNPPPPHVDDVVRRYNTVLHKLLDEHAPLKTHSVPQSLIDNHASQMTSWRPSESDVSGRRKLGSLELHG